MAERLTKTARDLFYRGSIASFAIFVGSKAHLVPRIARLSSVLPAIYRGLAG